MSTLYSYTHNDLPIEGKGAGRVGVVTTVEEEGKKVKVKLDGAEREENLQSSSNYEVLADSAK